MRLMQPAFASGELAPSLGGRVDMARFKVGLKTCRNCVIHRHGGASNRGGTQYLDNTYNNAQARLIPFEFSVEQNYVLEFTEKKMRVFKDGAVVQSGGGDLVVTSPFTLAQILEVNFTQSADVLYMVHPDVAPQALTRSSHTSWSFSTVGTTPSVLPPTGVTGSYSGSRVPDQGATTITSANPIVVTKTAHGFADGVRIYIDHAAGMPEISKKIFLVHWVSANAFNLEDEYGNTINGVGFGTYAPPDITAITQSTGAQITFASGHGFADGSFVFIDGVVGMTQVNGKSFRLAHITGDTFLLQSVEGPNIDSTGYTAYVSGGKGYAAMMPPRADILYVVASTLDSGEESVVSAPLQVNVAAPWGSGSDVKLSWTAPVTGSTPTGYSVYKSITGGGFYGFIGSTDTTSFTDNNISESGAEGPQVSHSPFGTSGNYPGSVAIFQQRLMFGRTDNQPQTIFASQTGLFGNFSTSDPLKDSDAIEATISSRQVNEIRHMLPMRQLLVMTSSTEWICAAANNNGAITPTSIAFDVQGYRGVSKVPPLIIGNTALFVQRGGQIVRDLRYQLSDDSYTGDDLSVMASHLTEGHRIVAWAYQGNPDSVIWCVREDGILLGLTYLREQEIWAWHRHDTNGYFESICSLPGDEGQPDEVYVVVRRLINGSWQRFVEQFRARLPLDDLNQAYFVDAGLSYDVPVSVAAFSGVSTNLVTTVTAHGLTTGDFVRVTDFVGGGSDSLKLFDDELNGKWFEVTVIDSTSFRLLDYTGPDPIPPVVRTPINASAFELYITGGTIRKGVTTLSGLDHLKNTPISILADGNVINKTVSNSGTVTLPRRFATIHAGLGYTSDLETLELENQPGELSGKKRQSKILTLRLANTRGVFAGSDENHLLELKMRDTEGYLEATRLFTGDKEMPINTRWERSARIFLRQTDPLPMTVLAIIPEVDVEE